MDFVNLLEVFGLLVAICLLFIAMQWMS